MNAPHAEAKLGRQFRQLRRRGSLLMTVVLTLGGCTSWLPMSKDVAPVVGPAPYVNRTPMNPALYCLRSSARDTPDLRIGVADFIDGSGASMGDNDVSGKYFSQRPDLMLIVALSKTGVRLVNRTSTAVAEWEMRQAMDRRLGDGKPVVVGKTRFDYRPVRAGEFLGSTFYVNGAITEINWALSNNVEEAGLLGATVGRRTYRVSIATDVVVTNSLTTEVVFARSYSKQLVGYETGGGVFRFVEAAIMPKARVELFQANIGQKQNEPVQQALRWVIELAGYEIISSLTGGDGNCDSLVPGLNDDAPGQENEDRPLFDAGARLPPGHAVSARQDIGPRRPRTRAPDGPAPLPMTAARIRRAESTPFVDTVMAIATPPVAHGKQVPRQSGGEPSQATNESQPKLDSARPARATAAPMPLADIAKWRPAPTFNPMGYADAASAGWQQGGWLRFGQRAAGTPASRNGEPKS
jgi:curli biogenesis system outer membrane secretion channel CsgG